jgi:hypothetical protein
VVAFLVAGRLAALGDLGGKATATHHIMAVTSRPAVRPQRHLSLF